MIKVVVDSGSTKSDWLVFENQTYLYSFETLGMNPEVLSTEELEKRLDAAVMQLQKFNTLEIYFYGSGCGTPRSRSLVYDAINTAFAHHTINKIDVREDTYAAVYATCTNNEKGIVCINGTGSNCSYYDGNEVHQAVDSLGFMAMDDFSGVSFGRQIIRSYYFKTLPTELANILDKEYNMSSDFIKAHFYKKENPNAYMASFLPFLITHKNHPFFSEMIRKEIQFFIDHYIFQFEASQNVPINFIGSTAYLLKNEIRLELEKNGLTSGHFFQKPKDGLILFFTQ